MDTITITTTINAPIAKVWENWTKPEHITKWNFASPDWHCPDARNNLSVGGEFHYTMAAKDKSMGFDFWGTYQQIIVEAFTEVLLGDGRRVKVTFEQTDQGTVITEEFEPERQNLVELQRAGWQMILDNFKQYTEAL